MISYKETLKNKSLEGFYDLKQGGIRKMNYEEEFLKMGSGKTFKPQAGQYTILIKSEPEETEYVEEDTQKVTPQIKLLVMVDDSTVEEEWFISKGKTTDSLFGQLILLGKNENGLKDKTISLIVKRTKDKSGKERNSYTIVESVKYMKN